MWTFFSKNFFHTWKNIFGRMKKFLIFFISLWARFVMTIFLWNRVNFFLCLGKFVNFFLWGNVWNWVNLYLFFFMFYCVFFHVSNRLNGIFSKIFFYWVKKNFKKEIFSRIFFFFFFLFEHFLSEFFFMSEILFFFSKSYSKIFSQWKCSHMCQTLKTFFSRQIIFSLLVVEKIRNLPENFNFSIMCLQVM